jgi:hypothetical protein
MTAEISDRFRRNPAVGSSDLKGRNPPSADLRPSVSRFATPAMRDQRIRFAQLTEFSYDLALLVATHRHQLDVQTSRRCRLCRPFGFVLVSSASGERLTVVVLSKEW